MGIIADMMRANDESGYTGANLTAKVCQDIVLKAIAESNLNRNVTIKGGVVMREITGDVRRATQDMDIDFIRYSLSDQSIDAFIDKLNVIEGVTFARVGEITELSQQDYHGKRIFVNVTDNEGVSVQSKIDLGVHTHLDIKQEEFCFDIAYDEEGVSLLINSKEQMFSEKLRSLLKFGAASTRFKDIFDIYYLKDKVSKDKLRKCFEEYILNDPGMREQSMDDIIRRLESTFKSERYKSRLASSDKNWIGIDTEIALSGIMDYMRGFVV